MAFVTITSSALLVDPEFKLQGDSGLVAFALLQAASVRRSVQALHETNEGAAGQGGSIANERLVARNVSDASAAVRSAKVDANSSIAAFALATAIAEPHDDTKAHNETVTTAKVPLAKSATRRLMALIGSNMNLRRSNGQPVNIAAGINEELCSITVYVLAVVTCAYIYNAWGYRTPSPDEGSPLRPTGLDPSHTGSFRFGLFDCDGCCERDLKICVCSFVCLGIRWADTLSQDKVKLGLGFWTLVLLHTLCIGLDVLTLDISCLVFIVIAVVCRQKLRAAFGLPQGTVRTYIVDCLLWTFCLPCAAAQEAREVEYLPTKLEAVPQEAGRPWVTTPISMT